MLRSPQALKKATRWGHFSTPKGVTEESGSTVYDHGTPMCPEKLRLMEEARRVLSLLAELMTKQRDVLDAPEDRMIAIDQEIERRFGEKERAMGALQQHRREHGC